MTLYVDASAFVKLSVSERPSAQCVDLMRADPNALHLAAARRAGEPGLPFLSYDLRLAQAARGLGFHVLGA